ncbi:hypothetical protein N9022_01075 [bacterium]|nr:hypothetical protein [Akkermansiaceae bacterium]MDB4450105.1 hypothetical protein [Akkermansiaceae bacterium]MDB4551727.1 hypothetical protein [bacterium]
MAETNRAKKSWTTRKDAATQNVLSQAINEFSDATLQMTAHLDFLGREGENSRRASDRAQNRRKRPRQRAGWIQTHKKTD